ncbi:Uncharacterised protein [Serratia marcescens]|uniref:hypothetical protein n=1 Tax=Serratia marcescens TaxID=615 RepID=UPI0021780D6A|nr:hypothetical protein [Serratia marcescens]CAI0866141.1 Uncharacterised protein [Serratia marcescens]CAI0974227.1 Uncharacterised protein [Serratia marcescens]
MSLSRFQLQFHLEKQANIIRQSPAFHAAIVKHGELLRETYKKHPLFYKIIFRNSRFIICSTILSIYYHQPAAALKDIKAFFKGKNMISENSLDSFLFFLRVGRRLEVKPCEHDKRQLRYKPTPHALAETQALIASMARPYQALAPQMPIAALLAAPDFLSTFFAAYGQLMLKEVYLIDLVPQSALFISKDAGHMVLLMLFIESIRQDSPFLLLSSAKIAKSCSVSRAHVNRILQAAEKSGLLTTTNNVVIELNSSFFIMAERYFSLYFAMVEFGFERVWQNRQEGQTAKS